MASFQAGELRGIITTDVMARGLDISDVTHVINFEFTDIPEQYIHRIGRTGRADKSGTAISFISPSEEEIQIQAEILMEKELQFLDFPENVEVATRLLEFEKDKKKVKQLLKRVKKKVEKPFTKSLKRIKKLIWADLQKPNLEKPHPETVVLNANVTPRRKNKWCLILDN